MRYQERIYIQNQHSGVRNMSILNVNMSSDMCIFNSPIFDISGATKIDCAEPCSCPTGYVLDVDGIGCTRIVTSDPTFNGSGSTVVAGDKNTDYSQYGAFFYPNIQSSEALPYFYNGSLYLVNSTGGTLSAASIVNTGTFWNASGSTSNGRLNNVGISADSVDYVGFSKCINIPTAGTYYIGLAADNFCRFKVNGVTYINFSGSVQENFKVWSVFPFELNAGLNIIELEGLNNPSSPSAFGAEVYHPTSLAALTASTSTGTTGLIFSTVDKIGGTFDIGTTLGYSCPSGYSLNTCSIPYTCSLIQKTTCTGVTIDLDQNSPSVYVISTATTIPLSFNFTGNTGSFSANSATFKYEIYKYSDQAGIFPIPPVYKSQSIAYSAFSGTNILNQNIPVSGLSLDGDYLIKGYYEFDYCTDFLSKLGKRIDTSNFRYGTNFQLYDKKHDFYFVGLKQADTPRFRSSNNETNINVAPLFQEYILIDTTGTTDNFTIEGTFASNVILTIQGSITSPDLFSVSGQVVTLLSGLTVTSADSVSVIYNRVGGVSITADYIPVTGITSGVTGGQGNNNVYYNTTTGKYELYTAVLPYIGNDILVSINTATLINGVDFYQSTTDPKRIILEGSIVVNDDITIIYYPQASVVDGVSTRNYTVIWSIDNPPKTNNGLFTLEMSPDSNFSSITYSATTPYEAGVMLYFGNLSVSGQVNNKYYYRVVNSKSYTSMCGDIISSSGVSETVPITITKNSINSY